MPNELQNTWHLFSSSKKWYHTEVSKEDRKPKSARLFLNLRFGCYFLFMKIKLIPLHRTYTVVAYLFTAESVRIVAIGDLIFFKSQTFTVRSSLPDTTLSPTVKTAEVTVLKKEGKYKSTVTTDA